MSRPQHADNGMVSAAAEPANVDHHLTQMLADEERICSSMSEQPGHVARRVSLAGSDSDAGSSSFSRQNYNSSRETAAPTIWREKVSQWCYRVIDHVQADRCLVYNVMTLLDRYIATASGSFAASDVTSYQIVAMSTLYLVLRLRDQATRLTVTQMVQMSRGSGVTPARIASTMKNMVQTLPNSWRDLCFAPSPAEFVVAYVEQLIVASASSSSSSTSSSSSRIQDLLKVSHYSSILDDATYLAELSVCDSRLRKERPSVIAYGAILNVLSGNAVLKENLMTLQSVTGYSANSNAVKSIYARIAYVHSQSLDYEYSVARNGVNEGSQTNSKVGAVNVIPQDDDKDDEDEREEAQEQQQQEEKVKTPPATTAVPTPPTTTTAPICTTSRPLTQASAVVSYDELSAVVDATLDATAAAPASTPSSDSEDDENTNTTANTNAVVGMKRVRSYSSLLGETAANKRTRLTAAAAV